MAWNTLSRRVSDMKLNPFSFGEMKRKLKHTFRGTKKGSRLLSLSDSLSGDEEYSSTIDDIHSTPLDLLEGKSPSIISPEKADAGLQPLRMSESSLENDHLNRYVDLVLQDSFLIWENKTVEQLVLEDVENEKCRWLNIQEDIEMVVGGYFRSYTQGHTARLSYMSSHCSEAILGSLCLHDSMITYTSWTELNPMIARKHSVFISNTCLVSQIIWLVNQLYMFNSSSCQYHT